MISSSDNSNLYYSNLYGVGNDGFNYFSFIAADIAKACKSLKATGLVAGPGGNVSFKYRDEMWISRSGISFDKLDEKNAFVGINIETGQLSLHQDTFGNDSSKIRPSSEWQMHLNCYKAMPEINFCIHTHPTMVQSLFGNIHLVPMFPDYHVLMGNVPHINYTTPCTSELANEVASVLYDGCAGVILENHGIITFGKSLDQAIHRTEIVEQNATIQFNRMSLAIGNNMSLFSFLSDDSLKELDNLDAEKFRKSLY